MGGVDFDREFEQMMDGLVQEDADDFLDKSIQRLRDMDAARARAGKPPVGVFELIQGFMENPTRKPLIMTALVAAMFRLRDLQDRGLT